MMENIKKYLCILKIQTNYVASSGGNLNLIFWYKPLSEIKVK